MLFKQFADGSLGCASHVSGKEHAGIAGVVDSPHAFETHTHVDHLSGHRRLALECGLPRVHAAAVAFPREPLFDGLER